MKILIQPETKWKKCFDCPVCDTRFEANQDDVDYDEFKISGYFFDDSAVCEGQWFVTCPTCSNIIFVSAAYELPYLVKRKIKEQK